MKKRSLHLLLATGLTLSSASFAQADFSSVYQAFQAAYAEKDLDKALPLAKQAYELGSQKFGASSANSTNLALSYANMLSESKQYELAYDVFMDVQEIYDDEYGEESVEFITLQLTVLSMLEETGYRFKDKTDRQHRALRKLFFNAEDVSEANPELATGIYYNTAKTLLSIGIIPFSLGRAIDFVEEAQAKVDQEYGKETAQSLEMQFILAALYQSKGRRNQAIEGFNTVVSILDDNLSFSHPWELAAHARLVSLYEEKGDSENATAHCVAIGQMTPWKDDITPTPLYRKEPKYPIDYARLGKEGWVKMEFDISASGFVENIRVVESSGGKKFERESEEALKGWRYAPKFENGKPTVATSQFVQLDFKLQV